MKKFAITILMVFLSFTIYSQNEPDSVEVISDTCSYSIYIPNSFTPNGDGLNDVFKPEIFSNCYKSYNIIIYNRNGNAVFKSDNIDDNWRGEEENDRYKTCLGQYFYKIYIDWDIYTEELNGIIYVVR